MLLVSESVGTSKFGETKNVNTPVAESIAKLPESKLKASSPTARIEKTSVSATSPSVALTSFAVVEIKAFSAKSSKSVDPITGL